MEAAGYFIRPIEAGDNQALATLIRRTLEEFNANKPGTVYFDEETDRLSTIFHAPQSNYYVLCNEAKNIVGAAGYYPTGGLPEGTCELVKMYLHPSARGKGLGSQLLQHVMDEAKAAGYSNMHLETMPELNLAIRLYKRFGFREKEVIRNSNGHFGCDIHMERTLF